MLRWKLTTIEYDICIVLVKSVKHALEVGQAVMSSLERKVYGSNHAPGRQLACCNTPSKEAVFSRRNIVEKWALPRLPVCYPSRRSSSSTMKIGFDFLNWVFQLNVRLIIRSLLSWKTSNQWPAITTLRVSGVKATHPTPPWVLQHIGGVRR